MESTLGQLATLASRLDSLSHVLVWSKSDPAEGGEEVEISLVEFPRIRTRFAMSLDKEGRFQLESLDHTGKSLFLNLFHSHRSFHKQQSTASMAINSAPFCRTREPTQRALPLSPQLPLTTDSCLGVPLFRTRNFATYPRLVRKRENSVLFVSYTPLGGFLEDRYILFFPLPRNLLAITQGLRRCGPNDRLLLYRYAFKSRRGVDIRNGKTYRNSRSWYSGRSPYSWY